MKIENFTKETATYIAAELRKVLAEFAQKHGLELQPANSTFDEKTLRMKVELKAEGLSESEKNMAELLQLPEVGKTFSNRGETFEIVGYDFGRRKYPIKAKSLSTGKVQLFVTDVKKLIK